MHITAYPSPNFGERRGGVVPDIIVLHYTAMNSASEALERLCSPDHQVSAHYVIDPVGQVYRLVDESLRAWHAGAGRWGACTDVNSRSIGIEMANDGASPFSATQMDALENLLRQIMDRWTIPPERVIAHSDMAPERKSDPGARFDWARLARAALSVWPVRSPDVAPDMAKFLRYAHQFGYADEVRPDVLLTAFRLRFRPSQTGPLNARDMAAMKNLALRYPVDRRARVA